MNHTEIRKHREKLEASFKRRLGFPEAVVLVAQEATLALWEIAGQLARLNRGQELGLRSGATEESKLRPGRS